MLFNSWGFFIFFPIVTIIYFIIPKKHTWLWLLVCSYYFYMSWNSKYALLIITSTIVTYLSGLALEKINNSSYSKNKKKNRKRLCVAFSLIINLGLLGYFKYFNFVVENLNALFDKANILIEIPLTEVLLPVGISFYTFQALSYTMDVYKGDMQAERHFGHYALFVSFFPQLVAGPIEKSKHLLPQIKTGKSFDYRRAKDGLVLMGWGLIKKVIIADRLAVIVNTVYNNVGAYSGIYLILATVFFAFQIYCDFSAYSDIAIGCAKVMGYDLMQNFRQPYFSKSVPEFWRRWHISLGTWFKEYLYIPLGGNRRSQFRTYINIAIVFLLSGFWHGANWTFIIWGGLHSIYQIFGIATRKTKDRFVKTLKVKTNTFGYKTTQILFTFVLVTFAWIFFRANSLNDAVHIIKNLSFSGMGDIVTGGLFKLGLDKLDSILACLSIIFLIVMDVLIDKKDMIKTIQRQNLVFRWLIYFGIIFGLILFGYYGGFDASNFIYFQF